MKRHDWIAIGIWALATMGVVLALGLPGTLHAVGDTKRAEIQQPKLMCQGCELTVKLASPQLTAATPRYVVCSAGKPAVLELTIKNPTANPVNASWNLSMMETGPVSPMMRVMPAPRQVWTQGGSLNVAAGESKTIQLDTKVAMKAGSSMYVVGLPEGKPGDPRLAQINLLSWNVQPAKAAARSIAQR